MEPDGRAAASQILADWHQDSDYNAERVRAPDAPKAVFAVCREGHISFEPEIVTTEGASLLPYPLDHPLLGGLTLPVGARDPGTDGGLFLRVRRALAEQRALDARDLTTLAAWLLASWVADGLEFLPVVVLRGVPGSGRSTLLRLLHSLSRRAVILDRFRPAVYGLLRLVTPTLLFDSPLPRLAPPDQEFLAASSERRLRAMTSRGPVRLYGPRVLTGPASPGSSLQLARGRTINIPLQNAAEWVQPAGTAQEESQEKAQERIQDEIRDLASQLAGFRLHRYGQVAPRAPEIRLTLAAARSWLMLRPFVTDEHAAELNQFFQDPARGAGDSLAAPERALLNAMLRLAHSSALRIQVQSFAQAANGELQQLDEPELSARKAGALLEGFGVQREDTRAGRAVVMNQATKTLIHQLADTYGAPEPAASACALCRQSGVLSAPAPAKKRPAKSAARNTHETEAS